MTDVKTEINVATEAKWCPFCNSQNIRVSKKDTYVEIGEYEDKYYEQEGEGVLVVCEDCGRTFVDFQAEA